MYKMFGNSAMGGALAVTREIYPQYSLAVFRYHGEVTVDVNYEAFVGYSESPEFQPDFNVFIDQSLGLFSEATFGTARQLSYLLQPYYASRSPGTLTAFYAPDELQFGVSRQYEATSQSFTERSVGIFRTLPSCARYLGIDPDDPKVIATLAGAKDSFAC